MAKANKKTERRPGAVPVWTAKNPRIYKLMMDTGLRQYEIAFVLGKHPDSFAKKLKFPLTRTETDYIVKTVKEYLKENPDFPGRNTKGDEE